ncbi:MAG: AbrB/MazE/SpoVT family DNA-binding domain-containing protein [archaeon]
MAHIKTVAVSSKGQIVIPEEMRKNLAIREGTKLVLIEREGKIVVEKEERLLAKMEKILSEEEKEQLGWMLLAEKSLAKIWDNPKDEAVWGKYL